MTAAARVGGGTVGQPLRIVHYLNQFFGGIGGEDKAGTPVEIREGAVGPGRAVQAILGTEGRVIATLVAGDDYVAERDDQAGAAIREALERLTPDLVLAGPAFDSGRYGLGCALACRVASADPGARARPQGEPDRARADRGAGRALRRRPQRRARSARRGVCEGDARGVAASP